MVCVKINTYGDLLTALREIRNQCDEAGKICSGLTAIAGIGLIAMPTGILAAAFSDAFQKARARSETPPSAYYLCTGIMTLWQGRGKRGPFWCERARW